jgi:hypothetical protein
MTPVASASNSCLAAWTACCRGSAQVQFWVQVGEGADALGQHGGVDRHEGCLWFRLPNWRTRSTGQARWWPWVPIRPNSPTRSCGLCSDPPEQQDRPAHHMPHQPRPIAKARMTWSPADWRSGHRVRLLPAAPVADLGRRAGTGPPESADPNPVCQRRPAGAALPAVTATPQPEASPPGRPAPGPSSPPAAPPQRLANEGWDRRFDPAGGPPQKRRSASVFPPCLRWEEADRRASAFVLHLPRRRSGRGRQTPVIGWRQWGIPQSTAMTRGVDWIPCLIIQAQTSPGVVHRPVDR